MLVLTRRRGEGVMIGPDVRIVVLEIRNGQVRLGIDAPAAVEVHREEVYARVQEENRKAAVAQTIPLDTFRQLTQGLRRRA